MASITKNSICLTITLLIFISTISSTQAQQTQQCATKLLDCASDLNTTTKPSDTCCNNIKETVANDLQCLCNLYNTPGLLASFNVSVEQALNLTSRCGIPATVSACTNTTGPTSAPPPPVPGNDGFRMTWTGLSSFLLLAAYGLFY